MSAAFDAYRTSYETVVQDSIAFSGLEHEFFLRAKVRVLAERFAAHFGEVRPNLVDVGCGVGRIHDALAPMVGSLAGSDVSGEAIERARQEHPQFAYRQSEGVSLPWDAAAFDVALAVNVFHHVPPHDWATLAAEMRRVTRAGGLVVLIEHNPWNPATRLAVARCPFDHDAVLLHAGRARDVLRGAGLESAESRHFLFLPSEAPRAGWLEGRLRRLPFGAQHLTVGTVAPQRLEGGRADA